MMLSPRILCIETSTEVCSVCLSQKGRIKGILEEREFRHSSRLVPMIILLLDSLSMEMNEIEAIALSKGPGSYTGLRVGASTAKGLAYSLDIPLIPIDTLEALVHYVSRKQTTADIVMSVLDARRNEVYASVFNSDLVQLKESHSVEIDEHFESSLDSSLQYLICGNAANKVDSLVHDKGNIRFLQIDCTSAALAVLAYESYLEEKFESLDFFEPLYLKPPNITTPKKTL